MLAIVNSQLSVRLRLIARKFAGLVIGDPGLYYLLAPALAQVPRLSLF